MNFTQIIHDNWNAWIAAPLPSVFALLLGIAAALFIGRMRYQGKIDALEERVKHKDEQIKVKDDTIQSLNTKPKPKSAGRARTRDSAPEGLPPVTPAVPSSEPVSPPDMGASLHIENDRIRKAITGTYFKFVFNPDFDQSKPLTFNPDGTIGAGRNANEYKYIIVNGCLEIYNQADQLYSRFTLLPDGHTLHHTNQSDTLSNRGQYMVPVAQSPIVSRSVNG